MTISNSRRRRGGFTLIEVLLVLVILVTLASLAVTAYDGIRRDAYIKAATVQIGLFRSALDLYQLNVRWYPSTDEGLDALRYPPASVPEGVWAGPYLKDPVPLDPWNMPYQYMSPGRYNVDSYDLWSLGPDCTDGTQDDILGWVVE
jgi:general secretion pathway protein G